MAINREYISNVSVKNKSTGQVELLSQFPAQREKQEQFLRKNFGPGKFIVSYVDPDSKANSKNARSVKNIMVFVGRSIKDLKGPDESFSGEGVPAIPSGANDSVRLAIEILTPHLQRMTRTIEMLAQEISELKMTATESNEGIKLLIEEVGDEPETPTVDLPTEPHAGLQDGAPPDSDDISADGDFKKAIAEFMQGVPMETLKEKYPHLIAKMMGTMFSAVK